MKIEEVVKLYEFLANAGWPGFFGTLFIIIVTFSSAILLGKEKLGFNKMQITILISTISVAAMVVLLFMKGGAEDRKDVLRFANCLKSEFVIGGFKVLSDSEILATFHCKLDELRDPTSEDLVQLLSAHPTEFIRVTTDDGDIGIRIIDPIALTAIDNYNVSHLPFIKAGILNYMSHKSDSMTYDQIRKEIDPYFDDEWIELMISKYDAIFTPYTMMDDHLSYPQSHGVMLVKTK